MLTTPISWPKQADIDIDVFRTFDGIHAKTMGRRGLCLGCVPTIVLNRQCCFAH
jgi:hypothetical protein